MPYEQAKAKATARSIALFLVVLAAAKMPISQDADNYYWLMFCGEIFVAAMAIVLHAPASWACALLGSMLATCHVAAATWWSYPIPSPDPYAIITPSLEYIQVAASVIIPIAKGLRNDNRHAFFP